MSEHPEDLCDKCGRPNISWCTDSELWNRVAGEYSILCPVCFAEMAEAAGVVPTTWRLSSEQRCEIHYLQAKVALLEHEADCHWCDICSPGEWTRGQCRDCGRLQEALEAVTPAEAPA